MSDEYLKQMRAAEQDVRTRARTLGIEVEVNVYTGIVDMRCGEKRWTFHGLLTAQIALEVAAEVRQSPILELLPTHAAACSNQNVLNPAGKYLGAEQCGCQSHLPRTEPLPTGTTEITYPTPNSVKPTGGM